MSVVLWEVLNLREEWLHQLNGLPYPALVEEGEASSVEPALEAYDAVQLFIERAQQVQPNFLPREELAHIVRICRLVEGMPLAPEEDETVCKWIVAQASGLSEVH